MPNNSYHHQVYQYFKTMLITGKEINKAQPSSISAKHIK
jgi:hypothetical protein